MMFARKGLFVVNTFYQIVSVDRLSNKPTYFLEFVLMQCEVNFGSMAAALATRLLVDDRQA